MVRNGIVDSNTHDARVKIEKNNNGSFFSFDDSAKIIIIIIIKSFTCNPIF